MNEHIICPLMKTLAYGPHLMAWRYMQSPIVLVNSMNNRRPLGYILSSFTCIHSCPSTVRRLRFDRMYTNDVSPWFITKASSG
jgi:hypothetical protein